MGCEVVRFGGGVVGFMCGPRRGARPHQCQNCLKRRSSKQCDFKMSEFKTCNRYLCEACAVHRDPDSDYCPTHPEAR